MGKRMVLVALISVFVTACLVFACGISMDDEGQSLSEAYLSQSIVTSPSLHYTDVETEPAPIDELSFNEKPAHAKADSSFEDYSEELPYPMPIPEFPPDQMTLTESLLSMLRVFPNWSEATMQTADNGTLQVYTRCFTLYYSFNDAKPNTGIGIDLTYPVLFSEDNGIADKVNEVLDEIVYRMLGGEHSADILKAFMESFNNGELMNSPRPGFGSDITYEMPHFSDKYVSFILHRFLFWGGPYPTTGKDILTIDLSTGARLRIDDVYERDAMINSFKEGSFTIEEGMYMPAGWSYDDEEVRRILARVVTDSLNGAAQPPSDRVPWNQTGTFFIDDFAVVSKNEALLKVYYRDSLNGYVILKLRII
jgi:hypothetical protein